ncbi:MAG: hypothetical protein JXR95_10060 [Deltaproteobacteria bacterium]|nr:hypothetical protein [Deltaproteobacteria bacterium]
MKHIILPVIFIITGCSSSKTVTGKAPPEKDVTFIFTYSFPVEAGAEYRRNAMKLFGNQFGMVATVFASVEEIRLKAWTPVKSNAGLALQNRIAGCMRGSALQPLLMLFENERGGQTFKYKENKITQLYFKDAPGEKPWYFIKAGPIFCLGSTKNLAALTRSWNIKPTTGKKVLINFTANSKVLLESMDYKKIVDEMNKEQKIQENQMEVIKKIITSFKQMDRVKFLGNMDSSYNLTLENIATWKKVPDFLIESSTPDEQAWTIPSAQFKLQFKLSSIFTGINKLKNYYPLSSKSQKNVSPIQKKLFQSLKNITVVLGDDRSNPFYTAIRFKGNFEDFIKNAKKLPESRNIYKITIGEFCELFGSSIKNSVSLLHKDDEEIFLHVRPKEKSVFISFSANPPEFVPEKLESIISAEGTAFKLLNMISDFTGIKLDEKSKLPGGNFRFKINQKNNETVFSSTFPLPFFYHVYRTEKQKLLTKPEPSDL